MRRINGNRPFELIALSREDALVRMASVRDADYMYMWLASHDR
jgi:hypothetical protein